MYFSRALPFYFDLIRCGVYSVWFFWLVGCDYRAYVLLGRHCLMGMLRGLVVALHGGLFWCLLFIAWRQPFFQALLVFSCVSVVTVSFLFGRWVGL